MSNFSTFFPSGGGGGEGAGINSTLPIFVSNEGNPIGYNATTGLYTNPVDDSVWLKTGSGLGDPTGLYPNAVKGLTLTYDPSQAFDNSSVGSVTSTRGRIAWVDSINAFLVSNGSASAMTFRQMTDTGTSAGADITFSGGTLGDIMGITTIGNFIIISSDGGNTSYIRTYDLSYTLIDSYTQSLTSPGGNSVFATGDPAAGTAVIWQVSNYSTNYYVYKYSMSSTGAITYLGRFIMSGGIQGDFCAVSPDEKSFWVGRSQGNTFQKWMVPTEAINPSITQYATRISTANFDLLPGPYGTTNFWYGGTLKRKTGETPVFVWGNTNNSTATPSGNSGNTYVVSEDAVGIINPYLDALTNAPLFIKLK